VFINYLRATVFNLRPGTKASTAHTGKMVKMGKKKEVTGKIKKKQER
jgi:hypothetical protein